MAFRGEVGKLSDLYADHIVANAVWVTLAFLDLVPIWVPLITTTRDLVVDWFRQTGAFCTGLNGFEQVENSRFRWLVSSRWMRASYGGLKLVVWGFALASIFMSLGVVLPLIVWVTVAVCLLRALPSSFVELEVRSAGKTCWITSGQGGFWFSYQPPFFIQNRF